MERKSQLFMIKLAVFKENVNIYNAGNNFVSVSELERLFSNIIHGSHCLAVAVLLDLLPA